MRFTDTCSFKIFPYLPKKSFFRSTSSLQHRALKPTTYTKFLCITLTFCKCFLAAAAAPTLALAPGDAALAAALPSFFLLFCAASSSSGTSSNVMSSSSYSVRHAGHRPFASSLLASSMS